MTFRKFLVLLLLMSFSNGSSGIQVQIGITNPFVFIQIGHGQFGVLGLLGAPANQIDEVVFNFPAGVIPGDGSAITGTPVIPVALLGFSGGGNANYRVTMNSATPLSNGATTIPFSDFDWITQDGDINAGRFNNTPNQLLQQFNFTFPNGRGVIDFLTFRYDNSTVYPAGTYTGRVVYTVTEL